MYEKGGGVNTLKNLIDTIWRLKLDTFLTRYNKSRNKVYYAFLQMNLLCLRPVMPGEGRCIMQLSSPGVKGLNSVGLVFKMA